MATSLGAAVLLVSLGTGDLSAQFNPNGWIQTDGWNYLMPLRQAGSCGGGGASNMERNWIAPHVIGLENPKAGTSYFSTQPGKSSTRIDFGGAAAATSWGGQGYASNDPTWVSNDNIEASYSSLAISMPNSDVVDYDAIAVLINTKIVPVQPGAPPALPLDDVMALATTYVENTTGAPIEVEICTASDDSIQVWVNNILTTNVSACRGTGGGCDDARLAYLPPGISKIATLVFEGGGGFGFRLGIRIGGVLITDATAAAAGLDFLGTGAGASGTVGQIAYTALRTIDQDPLFCQMTETISVNLKGSGPGADGDLLTVIESVTGSDLGNAVDQNIAISAVSNGGVVTDVLSTIPDSTEPNITALPLHAYIGNTCAAGSNTTVNGNVYTSTSLSGGDIWDGGDSFEYQYADVTGDFDIAIEMTNYSHASGAGRWGKFGLMARQDATINSRFTMAQAHGPANDDVARQAGRTVHTQSNALYEVGFANIPPRPRFLRLTRRGNVVRAWASVNPGLGDGRLNPCNDGNWVGANSDDWGAAAPATIQVGFANSEHNSDGCPAQTITFRILSCIVAPPALLSKTITWTGVARSAITDPGLSYDVSTDTTTTTAHSGRILNQSTTNGLAGQQTAKSGFLLEVTNSGAVGIFDDSQDIGTPPVLGMTTHSGGTYTVAGSGADIWDGGDDFHFAYKRVVGDFVATAHVASRSTNPAGDRWGRHGIMARHTCARNSKYSMVLTTFPTTNGAAEQDAARHQFRVNHLENGGTRDHYQVDGGTFATEGQLPTWMRLVRNGNTIYSYLAEDAGGSPGDWCLVGSDTTISRPDELLVGLAAHSHSGGNLATATFDNVTIEPLSVPSSTCTLGSEIALLDFNLPNGSAPPSSRVAIGSGSNIVAFAPQVVNNRLRLTQEGVGSSAVATWSSTELPLQNGFAVEFDAFMSHSALPGDANPADGMTFAVVQGSAADLFSPCTAPTGTPMVSSLPLSTLVGAQECPVSASTDNGGGAYTSVSGTGKDVWAGGDDFMYTYTTVTGDFDIAIEMTSYAHATNLGRWGKFGLMARRTDSVAGDPVAVALERTARYSFMQAHGPVNDDIVSFARRRDHNVPNFDQMDEIRDNFGGLPPRPRFLRLTRRGNVIQGWAAVDDGLANGSLNPQEDCNWRAGFSDDWGAGAPAEILVGFANSEHDSDACQAQTINFRLLSSNASTVRRTDLVGGGGGGLGYDGGTIRSRLDCNSSFAVEMDNWVGGGEPATDPGDGGSPNNDGRYHFGLDQNGSVASQQTNVSFGVPTASLPGIFSAMGVHVEVNYAPNGQVDVYATANDGSVGRIQVLSDLIQPIDGPAVLGFTAGTGGATANQEIDNLSISTVCCEGSTDGVTIVGPDAGVIGTPVALTTTVTGLDGAATYAWSIVSGPGTVTDNGNGTAAVNGSAAGPVVVSVTVNDGACDGAADIHTVTFGTGGGTQKPNDMNSDGLLDISDPVALLNHLFLSGDPPVCGDMDITHAANLELLDANGDGGVDISDPTYVLNFLFLGGPIPENCADEFCPCITITDCPENELACPE